MQKVKLPRQIDPIKSAQKRSDYQGVIAASDLERLAEVVDKVLADADVQVSFDIDAQGLTYFHGSLHTKVSLICQRCNEPFAQDLSSEFCFAPVQAQESLEELELPEAYDPVELGDQGEINLLNLFEDELILSLPIVALHAEGECRVTAKDMSYGEIEPDVEQPNPFAILKELKRNQE